MSQSSGTTMTGYRIRIVRQSASPIEHSLEDGRSVFVGESDSCGIQVKGEGVANIHCLIDVDGEDVFIQDWASDAGTKVNGDAIEDKTPIQTGDSVAIGSVTLVLAGGPSPAAKESSDNSSPRLESETKPREESVGMEHLGYDEEPATSTAVEEPEAVSQQPVVMPATGRLSDSFESASSELPDQTTVEAQGFPMTDDGFDAGDSLLPEAIDGAGDDDLNDAEPDSLPIENETEDAFDSIDDFGANSLTADDLDWDPAGIEDDEIDPEIVQLLKSEIEDLRLQLAERDELISTMERVNEDHESTADSASSQTFDSAAASDELVTRVDDLLAELAEHDERVETLQELLQTAEIQNQAEREERNCLETWVGEIEQRIGERESEWQAESDALRERLDATCEQRDQLQQQLHAASKRLGDGADVDAAPDETLQKLQQQNADLQASLEQSHKQCASLTRQIERLQTEEPESLQEERAVLAKEKADVSRMRFELSKQLQEIGEAPVRDDHPDREFAYKLQTLREHLREIHEEEKCEREQRGESLFGRISGLWKRVDDRY